VVIYRRTVVAGDASVTLSFSQTFAKSATVAVYRNVDPASPLDVTPSSGGISGGAAVTVPSLSAVTPVDRLVVVAGANGAAGTWTAPDGMTARVQRTGGTTDSAIMDQQLSAGGATGTRVATHSTSTNLVGVLIALKPIPTSFSYDDQGNRTGATPPTGGTTALGYDQANRLTSFDAASTATTYTYDGDGLRTSKTVNGLTTTYMWDLTGEVPLLLTEGTTAYVYGPGGLPLEQISGTDVTYYHQDQLGSTRALTDASGTVAATYSYDPSGNLTGSSGSITSPLGYAGEYADPESGLVYLRARYYDPATGQFLTRDPEEPVTGTPYAYVGGDPLNRTDPFGLCWGPGCWIEDLITVGMEIVRDPGAAASDAAKGLADFGIGFTNAALGTDFCGFEGPGLDWSSRVGSATFWVESAIGFAGSAAKATGWRVRFGIHDAHHAFGQWGQLPHLQWNLWREGVKESGRVLRIPLPRWWR
jgi:RHS repeat-associated protein